MISPLYDVLSQLRGEFVYLNQPVAEQSFIGKLVGLTHEVVTIEYYPDDAEGEPDGRVSLPLGSVSEVEFGTLELREKKRMVEGRASVKKQIEEVFRT